MCHMSCVMFFVVVSFSNWLVEGLLSAGPTPSSLVIYRFDFQHGSETTVKNL